MEKLRIENAQLRDRVEKPAGSGPSGYQLPRADVDIHLLAH